MGLKSSKPETLPNDTEVKKIQKTGIKLQPINPAPPVTSIFLGV